MATGGRRAFHYPPRIEWEIGTSVDMMPIFWNGAQRSHLAERRTGRLPKSQLPKNLDLVFGAGVGRQRFFLSPVRTRPSDSTINFCLKNLRIIVELNMFHCTFVQLGATAEHALPSAFPPRQPGMSGADTWAKAMVKRQVQ